MKKYIFFSLMALFLFSACEEEEIGPVLNITGKPAITSPAGGANIVLTAANAANPFPAITWTAADFGFQAGVAYTVELDKAGNNFKTPTTLGVVNALTLGSLTNERINNILQAAEYPGGVAVAMQVRVAAKVSPEVEVVYSDPVNVNITPFEVVVNYPKLQVPGNYQGWNPAESSTVIFSRRSDGKFEGYINFSDPATKYKYTDGPSWDVNYGDDGDNGTLDRGGADIAAKEGAGIYRLNVDLNAKTHTALKTDWGLIGDATPTGWDSDTDLTYDAATGTLKVTLDLAGGKSIKFRANNGWDINLGDDGNNRSLEYGGANIPVAESGNYTVELVLNVAKYTYKLKKN